MSANKVAIGGLGSAIEKMLDEYSELTTESMKEAVKNAGAEVREEIMEKAPRDTGKYARSWKNKVTLENSHAMQVTVYNKDRYRLAHLLEHGHAKRGGGRVRAYPHIAEAEEHGNARLEADIKKALEGD